jgi:hypothetical protein
LIASELNCQTIDSLKSTTRGLAGVNWLVSGDSEETIDLTIASLSTKARPTLLSVWRLSEALSRPFFTTCERPCGVVSVCWCSFTRSWSHDVAVRPTDMSTFVDHSARSVGSCKCNFHIILIDRINLSGVLIDPNVRPPPRTTITKPVTKSAPSINKDPPKLTFSSDSQKPTPPPKP